MTPNIGLSRHPIQSFSPGDRWMDFSRCGPLYPAIRPGTVVLHPKLFEDEGNKTDEHYQAVVTVARMACRACPVRNECTAAGIKDPEATGIMGGMTEAERTKARNHAVRLLGDLSLLTPEDAARFRWYAKPRAMGPRFHTMLKKSALDEHVALHAPDQKTRKTSTLPKYHELLATYESLLMEENGTE